MCFLYGCYAAYPEFLELARCSLLLEEAVPSAISLVTFAGGTEKGCHLILWFIWLKAVVCFQLWTIILRESDYYFTVNRIVVQIGTIHPSLHYKIVVNK